MSLNILRSLIGLQIFGVIAIAVGVTFSAITSITIAGAAFSAFWRSICRILTLFTLRSWLGSAIGLAVIVVVQLSLGWPEIFCVVRGVILSIRVVAATFAALTTFSAAFAALASAFSAWGSF